MCVGSHCPVANAFSFAEEEGEKWLNSSDGGAGDMGKWVEAYPFYNIKQLVKPCVWVQPRNRSLDLN